MAAIILMGFAITATAQSYGNSGRGNGMGGSYDAASGGLYETQLTGSQEVPPVSTNTTGYSGVWFDRDGMGFNAWVSVWNGDDITQAHLHCGDVGENGPAVVDLFHNNNGVDTNGELTKKMISHGDIKDVDCDVTIGYDIDSVADLARAVENGDIYVNVHDKAHPNGVARGQLGGNQSGDDNDDHGSGWNWNEWKDDWTNDEWKDHRKDCDEKWSGWMNQHSSDNERWKDSSDWNDCKDYGYNDGKDSWNWDYGQGGHHDDGKSYGADGRRNDGYWDKDNNWHHGMDGKSDNGYWDGENCWHDYGHDWKNDNNDGKNEWQDDKDGHADGKWNDNDWKDEHKNDYDRKDGNDGRDGKDGKDGNDGNHDDNKNWNWNWSDNNKQDSDNNWRDNETREDRKSNDYNHSESRSSVKIHSVVNSVSSLGIKLW